MSQNFSSLPIPKKIDSEILKSFRALITSVSEKEATFSINFKAGLRFSGNSKDWDWEKIPDNLARIIELDGNFLERFNVSIENLAITFKRAPKNLTQFFDEIELRRNATNNKNEELSDEFYVRIFEVISENFGPFEPFEIPNAPLLDEEVKRHSFHEEILQRLEKLNKDLIEDIQEGRRKLDERYFEKERDLEKAFSEKEEKIIVDFEEKEKELKNQWEELDRERAAFDERNNTFARRAIRDSILK